MSNKPIQFHVTRPHGHTGVAGENSGSGEGPANAPTLRNWDDLLELARCVVILANRTNFGRGDVVEVVVGQPIASSSQSLDVQVSFDEESGYEAKPDSDPDEPLNPDGPEGEKKMMDCTPCAV